MHRLVGHLDVNGVTVRVRIDGDSGDAHLFRRLDDAAGDLAAIGNQDLLEHRTGIPSRRSVLLGNSTAGLKPRPRSSGS
jgi:hypothetical protein